MSTITALEPREAGDTYARIGRALTWLAEHHLDQPSLDDAARAAGLSPFHFQRQFTRHVGVSPKSYVAHLTLERAKHALDSGESVLGAALDAGLSGPSRLHDLCLKVETMTPGQYAKGGAGITIHYGFHPSLFGLALVMTTGKGLCGLAFGADEDRDAMLVDMSARWPRARFVKDERATAKLAEKIFTGSGELPIQLYGTPWQIKVWQALLAIPPGTTTTYRNIAIQCCTERASRAAGAAIGRNPVSWLIPCHRVLASNGALTGYHWGVGRKRAMLAYEAAHKDARAAAA
jgi:AraC family transcriptional regulator of adaptative response/methylated-DNA-[protein]-cysteine methyltransferase